eukprot:COSAG05_NODE_6653_length_925_cov_1.297821_1_plen_154_part_10
MVNPRSLVIFKPKKEKEKGETENVKKNTGANDTRGAVHSLREHQQGVKLPEIAPDLARRRIDAKPAAGPAARFTPRLGGQEEEGQGKADPAFSAGTASRSVWHRALQPLLGFVSACGEPLWRNFWWLFLYIFIWSSSGQVGGLFNACEHSLLPS